MAVQLDIDVSTLFDNVDEQQVEFTGDVDGDVYDFAVQYDVLEAITGDAPENDADARFKDFIDVIRDAALVALSRNSDAPVVLVSESDLKL